MTPKPTLRVTWIALRRAREYVADHHRHLPRVQGGILALGCYDGERLCGVSLITYTLPEESGASLRGAGWIDDGATDGGEWGREGRPRNTVDARPKRRWRAA